MTPADLRALSEAATPGEWVADGQMVCSPSLPEIRYGKANEYSRQFIVTQTALYTDPERPEAEANAAFAAACVNAIRAQLAGEAGEEVSGAVMNANLCTFAQDWLIDGDYMRCRECGRPQIATYASMVFPHAPGCRNMGLHRHPWQYFASLIRPIAALPAQPNEERK